MLLLRHPALCALSCQTCQTYLIEDDYTVQRRKGDNAPLKRPAGTFPPCRYSDRGMSCPKGTPEKLRTLSERNELAYSFHKECRAIGQFPDDAIVRRNAGIIEEAERFITEARQGRIEQMLAAFLGIKLNG